MSFSSPKTWVFLWMQFLFTAFLIGQVPTKTLTRDQYLDSLEARHKNLSLEFKEIVGVQFDVPQNVLIPDSEAQNDFDSLPGPLDPNTLNQVEDELISSEVIPVEIDEKNESDDELVYESEVIPPRYLEDEIGLYYLQPFIGLSIVASDMTIGVDTPSMDGDLGYSLGVRAGRRWGNLEGEIHFGYLYNSYSGDFIDNGDFYSVTGIMEATSIGTRFGYGLPYGDRGWYKAAAGFGFANRRHSNNVSIDDFVTPGESFAESVFSYDLLLAMGYQLGIGWDAILSYRFLNLSDYREFDDVSLHLFEVGLGKNF